MPVDLMAELNRAKCSLFRIEAFESPALTEEAADFERFLAGSPTPPEEMAWFRPWIDQVSEWTDKGVTLTRVRVLAQPPTDYQRWLIWGGPFFGSIGERIRYMDNAMADHIGLPAKDWWLIDDDRVIMVLFEDGTGEVIGYGLIDDPNEVGIYRLYRDLALENSTAETIAAV